MQQNRNSPITHDFASIRKVLVDNMFRTKKTLWLGSSAKKRTGSAVLWVPKTSSRVERVDY